MCRPIAGSRRGSTRRKCSLKAVHPDSSGSGRNQIQPHGSTHGTTVLVPTPRLHRQDLSTVCGGGYSSTGAQHGMERLRHWQWAPPTDSRLCVAIITAAPPSSPAALIGRTAASSLGQQPEVRGFGDAPESAPEAANHWVSRIIEKADELSPVRQFSETQFVSFLTEKTTWEAGGRHGKGGGRRRLYY